MPTVAILIAVGLVNFYSYQDVTEELVLERGQNLPRLSAARLSTDLKDLTEFVSDVARDAVNNLDASTTQQDVLNRAGGQSLVFDGGVLILDTFGKVVAAGPNHPERMGLDWSDRLYFRQLVRNLSLGYNSPDPIFTNIIDDGSRETGAIAVAVPIVTDQGEFLGSVVGIFSLLSVNDFYSRIVKLRIGGSGSSYLVDGNGRVIYHSDARYIAADFSAQPAVELISKRQAGNIRTRDIDGEDIVASFAPVPGTPWGLVTEESWSSLIGASQGYQRFLLLLLVLGVAVPVLFVVIGVKQIMRPLKDLAIAARRMAKGDFDEPIAVQSGDEIMRLADEFNVMAGALKESHQAMAEANESLEESNKRLEETLVELRDTQERVSQQERLHALGTMASGIAHDFNNALSPILGYSAFLLEDADQFDETKLEYLRVISTSAQDAAAVIGRLRNFYRQREGSELMMSVDINDVVARAISLTQPRWRDMAQSKGIDIQLSTQLADDLSNINGDEAELRTALSNVIFNAVDAMPDGGKIILRTYQDGEEIVLEVTDTGMGMSDEVLRRAMEPFFTTKDEQGTGMGLAMVYGTLQRHSGRLEVQSEVGQGTTVGFRLPVRTEDREILTTFEAEPLPAGLRFLVVDDELRVRDMVGDFLRREGSTVETATNGLDALEKFQLDNFDIVITDRGMPEMNGDALAAAIKEAAPNTPIIMLTGFGEMMISAGERPPGVDRLLGKPVTPAALRRAVTALRAEYAAAD